MPRWIAPLTRWLCACGILLGGPSVAQADPQYNAGLLLGGAAAGTEGGISDRPEFLLGLRGDVMFLRDDAWDFGVGPYLEFGTLAFDELQFGGGATFHLPVHETFPLVASLGPYARYGDDDFGIEPGIATSLFWGTRSYNFHEDYIIAAGLNVGYRASFGESKESALLISAQVDLVVLAMPFIALANLMRGPTDEAGAVD